MHHLGLAAHLAALNAQARELGYMELTEDLDHWIEYGVHTPAQLDAYLNYECYVSLYKDTWGIKPRWLKWDDKDAAGWDLEIRNISDFRRGEEALSRRAQEQLESMRAEAERPLTYSPFARRRRGTRTPWSSPWTPRTEPSLLLACGRHGTSPVVRKPAPSSNPVHSPPAPGYTDPTPRYCMLILLLLAGCRTADITVPTDSSVMTGIEQQDFEGDQGGECSDGGDNDRDGLFDCDDPECWGSTDCSADTGTAGHPDTADPTGDDTAASDDTGGSGGDDTSSGDTAATALACADGTVELQLEGAAFCQHDEAASHTHDSAYPTDGAAAACGTGWHVCTDAEWQDRNDGCDSALAFQGLLDAPSSDDNSCQVVDDLSSASCGSDLRRSGQTGGTCSGIDSNDTWGLGARAGVTYSGVYGVMCCL